MDNDGFFKSIVAAWITAIVITLGLVGLGVWVVIRIVNWLTSITF